MPCDGLLGQGALFQVGDQASPEVFTTVADLRDITPTIQRESIDASNHDTANAWREFVPGMATMEIGLEGNYVPDNTTHNIATDGMIGLIDTAGSRNMKIVFPDSGATTWSFEGFFTEVSPSLPSEGLLSFSASVQVCGRPTLA